MKRFWGVVVSVSCFLAVFGGKAFGFVQCTDPQFSTPPAFGPDKTYDLDLYSDCTVTMPPGGDLATVQKFLVSRTLHVTSVNVGPVSETDDGMPGEYYDVTDSAGDPNGDSLTIRSDVHIATDGRTKLIYQKNSKDINATGESKHLKLFNEDLAVQSPGGDRIMTLRYGHTVHVTKPDYAPTGIFTNRVKKDVTADLIESRDEITSGLLNGNREH